MRLIRSVVSLAVLAVTTACATKGSNADTAPPKDRDLITQEEIVATKATDAYSVVRALRPGWLLGKTVGTRRVQVNVYVEGNKAGGTSILSQYNVGQIKEIRYLSPDDATTRFGTGNQAGAILVTLRS
jgi:hypothetical protein